MTAPDPATTDVLSGETDAVHWADEFCKRFMIWAEGGVLSPSDAMGLMLAWFANAIETGRDAGLATGAARERQRIRQQITDLLASGEQLGDGIYALRKLADLLDGAS